MNFSRWLTVMITAGVGCIVVAGCHRGYYRRQADAEAQKLIREKANDPRWCLPDGTIDIDPQSRMFDPFSSDHPPLPPDDPAAHAFMEQVDCKPGYPHWHANGDTDFVENPEWMAYLPVNEQGVVELDMQRAVNLALIHSPDYQQQREELYLSALDVSLERFGFDSQLFAGFNSFITTEGRLRNGASQSLWEFNNGTGGASLRRAGITGSTLAVGLANSIIWQFAGADTQTASTVLDFSFVQPLLRGAGRERILESLTQAERTLLGNVRQMERYRRGFYLEITNGRAATSGPSRGGNFLNQPRFGSDFAGGFMGLLRDQQAIRIQEFNVVSLRSVLEQFRQFRIAERIDDLQVRQTETQLYDAQRSLMTAKNNYLTSLDRFKRLIGLPPDLNLKINDPLLKQFELIDDENNLRQSEINNRRSFVGDIVLETDQFVRENRTQIGDDDPLAIRKIYELNWSDDLAKKLAALKPHLEELDPLFDAIRQQDYARVKQDISKLRAIRPSRIESLRQLKALVKNSDVENVYDLETSILEDDAVVDPNFLDNELTEVLANLEKVKTAVDGLKTLIDDLVANGKDKDSKELYKIVNDQLLSEIPEQLTKLGNVSLELALVQAQARTDTITLPDVELKPERAVEIAREFRRDWMNARASLVDRWRQIEFAADDLETGLDLVFDGDIRNTGDNPFRVRYETGQLRAGFRIDAPLTRLTERNRYREILIQYQRARRQFYQFQDEISRGLRQSLREIDLNKLLFELNRVGVKVNVKLVEQARLRLDQPPQGVGRENRLGATTARDLTGAINGLQRAQNTFLNTWVEYEVSRRNLDFDLGTMQLTADSVWLDPGRIDEGVALREDLSCQLFDPSMVEPGTDPAGNAPDPPQPTPIPMNFDSDSSGSFNRTPAARESNGEIREIRWESLR